MKAISLNNLISYINLSHSLVDSGRVIKNEKYIIVNAWPIKINGSSTGRPPIHVKISHDLTNVQNKSCERG